MKRSHTYREDVVRILQSAANIGTFAVVVEYVFFTVRNLHVHVQCICFVFMLVLYVLVSYVSPWAQRLAEVIENVTEQSLALGQLSPGKFFELENTGWVIYAESEDQQKGVLENVFLQRTEDEKVIVEVAESAKMMEDEDSVQIFVMFNGKTVEGVPGQGNYAISTYDEHLIYPPRTDFSREAQKAKYQDIKALLSFRDASYTAEFLQRASIILSTLLLTLLAVPLSKVRPNSGRFSRIAAAALIYILYLNLVIVACSWIKREESYGLVSLLFVHLIVMVCTYFAYHQSLLTRFKKIPLAS